MEKQINDYIEKQKSPQKEIIQKVQKSSKKRFQIVKKKCVGES